MTEEAIQAMRKYQREYYRKYRKDNPEKVNAANRKWRRNNPEKVRQYNQRYWEKKASGISR